jgi:hypothetical protein
VNAELEGIACQIALEVRLAGTTRDDFGAAVDITVGEDARPASRLRYVDLHREPVALGELPCSIHIACH